MTVEVELVAVSGPDGMVRASTQIGRSEVSLGRSSDCEIVLPDPAVSRKHAALVLQEDGTLGVRDLGSRAGTTVNLVRVDADEVVRLTDRDLVGIGPWRLLARVTGDSQPEATPESNSDMAMQPRREKEDEHTTSHSVKGRSDPLYATRASIFLRLKADGTVDRELGWQEFAQKYSRVIAGFARNAGLPPQEADDVLQDVLLGFFRVSDAFEYDPEKGRFRGYLKRVTLNAIRARFRRRRPDVGIEDHAEPALPDDMDEQWDRQWTEQMLSRAMAQVRDEVEEKTWRAFELYGVRGTPATAVAAETGMSEAAIRHAKMRLTKRLREVVDRMRAEEG
ncbi:MAG: sigma-70 family RNA polymerase sigma factor [Phycisphaerales bacterium]|nr:sigma-70 family RNA polymerase sigma factor [Phycisphaerales bacterium]